MSVAGVVLFAAAGMAAAGYPIGWLLLSPKAVLGSSDAAFVNGFGAGVAMTLGVIVGITMLGFAWSQVARRFGPLARRRIEIGLMVSFFVVILVVSTVWAAH